MLFRSPKSAFRNPSAKWLDPTGGVGNFLIVAYLLLMDGLAKWQPNASARRRHIIDHMLYMVELNSNNCASFRRVLGSKNVICGDFLKADLNPQSFDYIVGNPPFQHHYETGNGGKSKLYELITLKAYTLLKMGGILSFVVPDSMFGGNRNSVYSLALNNSVPLINLNITEYFPGIQQPTCFFVLVKEGAKTDTVIESPTVEFRVTLKDRPINPIREWTPFTERLVQKYVGKRNLAIYNRGKSVSDYNSSGSVELLYTPTKRLKADPEESIGLGKKKAVLYVMSPTLDFEMDYTGSFGVGPNTMYIPFKNKKQGDAIQTFLSSSEYKTLALSTRTSRKYLKIALIEHLKIPGLKTGLNTRKRI